MKGFILTIIIGCLFSISIQEVFRYKEESDKYFELYQDERDCRFALEVIWRRKTGDFIHNPSICDLNPYEEGCLCYKSFKNRSKE